MKGSTDDEYAADLDVIVDPELWRPETMADQRALMAWGPPVPVEFIAPSDLDELIASAS